MDVQRVSAALGASPGSSPAQRLSIAAFGIPDWASHDVSEPGITLIELLAYVGDTLSFDQDQFADEAYGGAENGDRLRLDVSRRPALCLVADDRRAFVVTVGAETGDTTVHFGEGEAGERPSSGLENVAASSRHGVGEAGNLELSGLGLQKPFVVIVASDPRASARWFGQRVTR